MANPPGATHLGQGIPGGASSLPGEIAGPSPGSIPVAPGFPKLHSSFDAPIVQRPSVSPPLRDQSLDQQSGLPSRKAYSISTAMALLDRVRRGETPWQDAQSVLKDLPDDQRNALRDLVMKRHSKSVPPTAGQVQQAGAMPLDELRALQPPTAGTGGLLSHLASDVTGMVKGFIPGLALAGKAIGSDVLHPDRSLGESHFYKDVLKPIGKQEGETWGPLVKGYGDLLTGDIKGYNENRNTFNSRFNAHPLGPLLDAFAVASAGAGAAGRLGEASRVMQAGAVSKDANGLTTVGAKAGVNLKVTPMKNGLWQVRDRGRIVASRFPTEDTAIAHAQSLTAGGVAHAALKTSMLETSLPAGVSRILPDLPEWKNISKIATPEHLQAHPVDSFFPVTRMPDGEIRVGMPGHSHEDSVTMADWHKYVGVNEMYKKDAWDKLKDQGFVEGTGVLDPNTGKVAQVNLGDQFVRTADGYTDQRTGMTDPDLAGRMKKAADEVFSQKGPQSVVGADLERKSPAQLGSKAFFSGGPRGSLIDAYENARGITHELEHKQIMEEVMSVLENPNLRLDRRDLRTVFSEMQADLAQTRASDKARVGEVAADLPSFISPEGSQVLAKLGVTGMTTLREASDLVRAGAIYLRPAYLPNNWAGNLFMNVVHQGVFAPINLAKSMAMDKHIGERYTRAIDQSLGANAAEVVTSGKGRGYIASVTQPAAHIMGAIADQPFRRASWLHEARRAGYSDLPKVKELFDKASTGDEAALRQIAVISRKAQEEIVKFGHMNDIERGLLRNLVFVYSWMRGATRYAGRFPFQHPIQTAVFNQEAHQGNQWLDQNMGGVPSFLVGAIPVGHDKNGNPILINPFSLNPLGTGLQIAQAAQGTYNVIRHPSEFNKFASTDVVSLLNPIAQSYISAREGGKSVPGQVLESIAAVRLAKDLKHPGRGSIYPTTRKEAIGHFTLGSLFPRQANQAAITKSLEREGSNHPLALIPAQVERYKKLTGETVPPEFVAAYQADLVASEQQKDFQRSYADRHGASGFRSLPPQNRAEAAVDFLRRHKLIADKDLNDITDAMHQMTTDAEFNDLANSLWSSTQAGSVKRAWDQMMNDAKGQQQTRKKQ